MHESEVTQSCPTLKNAGEDCYFLLHVIQVKVTQWCPTFCDSMDYRPPGSSVHGTLQARVLEWGAIAFSIIDYTKAFNCVDHNKLENSLSWKYQTTLLASCEICMQIKKQQ